MDFKTCYEKYGIVKCLQDKIVDQWEGRVDHSQYWNLSATANALIAAYMINLPKNSLNVPTKLTEFSSFCNQIMQNQIIPSGSFPFKSEILAYDGYKKDQKWGRNFLASSSPMDSLYRWSVTLGVDNWNFITQLHYSNIRGFWAYLALHAAWIHQLGLDIDSQLKIACEILLESYIDKNNAYKAYKSVWSTPSDYTSSYADNVLIAIKQSWNSIYKEPFINVLNSNTGSNQSIILKIINTIEYSIEESKSTAELDMTIKEETKADKGKWKEYLQKGSIIVGSLFLSYMVTDIFGD